MVRLSNLAARWRARRAARAVARVIVCDDTGVELVADGKPAWRAEFADITAIAAYKVDLLTTDEIRLDIECDGGRSCYTVSEDDAGFAELDAALAQVLPGYVEDWFPRVMKPAFARNWIRLYHRPDLESAPPHPPST